MDARSRCVRVRVELACVVFRVRLDDVVPRKCLQIAFPELLEHAWIASALPFAPRFGVFYRIGEPSISISLVCSWAWSYYIPA